MFKIKKKYKKIDQMIYSPMEGKIIRLEDVNDPVFSQHLLGDGIAVFPKNNILYSPVNGRVCTIFPTWHAIGLIGDNGAEILIHIGIDTVMLKGKGFDCQVSVNQKVNVGDVLMKVDFDAILKAGYDPTVMIVVTNKDKYQVCMKENLSYVNQGMPLFETNGAVL